MIDATEPPALRRFSTLLTAYPARRNALWKTLGVAVAAIALLTAAAIPAAAAELMRVTFVRHAESAGNASGLIDTSTPGPVLTATGQQQAQAVVGTLGDRNFDAIYASTMVRTQLTAAPMSQYLRLPIQVLPGLQEIEAGVFEGTPESQAANGYGRYPLAWALQGNRDLRIPGSIDGNEFEARMNAALQQIYDNGDRNSVVFSHGGAIMFWTMMNAQNLTVAQKIDLLRSFALSNTNYVVVEGNPQDGWTLVNWNGKEFSSQPSVLAEVGTQIRTLVRQLNDSAAQVFAAFSSGNLATIATALNRGFADAAYSLVKFTRAVGARVIEELQKIFTPVAPARTVTTTSAVAEKTTTTASKEVTPAASTETETGDSGTSQPSAERRALTSVTREDESADSDTDTDPKSQAEQVTTEQPTAPETGTADADDDTITADADTTTDDDTPDTDEKDTVSSTGAVSTEKESTPKATDNDAGASATATSATKDSADSHSGDAAA